MADDDVCPLPWLSRRQRWRLEPTKALLFFWSKSLSLLLSRGIYWIAGTCLYVYVCVSVWEDANCEERAAPRTSFAFNVRKWVSNFRTLDILSPTVVMLKQPQNYQQSEMNEKLWNCLYRTLNWLVNLCVRELKTLFCRQIKSILQTIARLHFISYLLQEIVLAFISALVVNCRDRACVSFLDARQFQ